MKLRLGLLLLSLVLPVSLQAEDNNHRDSDHDNQMITPPLLWKYGWQDGGRANTIGSLRQSNPLPAATATLPSGYSPNQISAAYGFSLIASNGNGAGQTIAIVDAYGSPTIQSDLNTFCSTYGIPTTSVSVYYPQGNPAANSGWAAETMLDVEWAHGSRCQDRRDRLQGCLHQQSPRGRQLRLYDGECLRGLDELGNKGFLGILHL